MDIKTREKIKIGNKIGVYGGSFDPPHNAHVLLSRAFANELNLDELYIIPSGNSWQKARQLTAAEHRLKMCELAFLEKPLNIKKIKIDDREIKRAGPTYTIDTLLQLKNENPDAQLYLLIGADQAANFHTWHEYEKIANIATICVAMRDNEENPQKKLFNNYIPPKLFLLKWQVMQISSTQIRQLVQKGQSILHLVAPQIAKYICEKNLFR